jgi:hypothetical protein
MGTEEFAAALGGEVGGHVNGKMWFCTCGDTGTEISEQLASLALYFHRRSGHQPVAVELGGDDAAS